MRWSSLVELRGDDDSATSTVAVILEYVHVDTSCLLLVKVVWDKISGHT